MYQHVYTPISIPFSTIKRAPVLARHEQLCGFQFHLVRLKAFPKQNQFIGLSYFNSI